MQNIKTYNYYEVELFLMMTGMLVMTVMFMALTTDMPVA